MAIPNEHLGIATNRHNAAEGRNVIVRQRANGQLFRENDESGEALPTIAELQSHYDSWKHEQVPSTGFDHNGTSYSFQAPDCIAVAEIDTWVSQGGIIANDKKIELRLSNGETFTATTKAQWTAFSTAFHAAVCSHHFLKDR